ncbi:MAG: hypothetical protein KDD10_23985, partial [Phaeodactylibacter sp.]|nr:hypothetical protein [Phaeodactylibacter sp.]
MEKSFINNQVSFCAKQPMGCLRLSAFPKHLNLHNSKMGSNNDNNRKISNHAQGKAATRPGRTGVR